MNTSVDGEITSLTEGFAAYFTCVRLLVCMDRHVTFETFFVSEGIATHVTFVRLLVRMNDLVSRQITRSGEKLTADFTFVRLLACMDSHMLSEITILTEGFATDFAFVRLLARVDEHMCFDMLPTEGLAAGVACVHHPVGLRGKREEGGKRGPKALSSILKPKALRYSHPLGTVQECRETPWEKKFPRSSH